MNNIFVSWKQKIESRIISDLKSQYTESEEQIRQRKEQFLKKQKKIILIEIIAGAVFLAFLIIRAAFLQDDILLSRNSFGQGSKEVQLSLKKDDKKKEITYKLDEQKLSAEEESKVYIQFFKKLKKIMMKNNTSLKQIQTPLNLPDTVDGYPFEITYELAEDGYIRLDGSINEEEQAKLKRGETYRTYIVVTARYGEYRKSKKYEIRIVPKKNISQTNVFYKIQQYLKKEEQENRYSRDIKIPSVYKDIEITKRQENQGGISGILILFVTVCIFIPLHNYLKLQEEGKKCQEQAERDFPVIVHLLTLYMGAGLSFFSAVKRISQNYQKQRELDDSKKYAFEKMMRMEQQMSNGVSQREACQDWGMLPQIDYEDTDAVQFMYRFYNKVRKLGFSKELLETYIQTKRQKEYYDIEEVDKTSAKVRDSSKIKQDRRSNNESISYEEFFKEELELEKQKIESPNNRKQKTGDFQIGIKNGRRNSRREVQRNERNRDEKIKNQRNRNQKNKDFRSKSQSNENNYLIVYNGLKIISVICTFLAVILEGIFVFYGMRSGFTRQLFQYSVGGMLLIIVFACGFIWSAQTVRKIKQKNKSNSMNSIKDNINKQNKVRHRKRGEQGSSISDKFIQEKELQNRPQMIKTEVDWEAEGDWESGTEGTTILNYGNESEKEDGKICHPMLRDMELGIIYVIKNCPFYIGSAEGVNHLHIQDKTVSREHAVILEDIYEGDGQGYILRDMGSTNGTWLNGKKIKRGNQEQLEDGAVIRFAKKEYEFLIQDI